MMTEVDQTKAVITASLVSLFQNLVVVVVTLVVLSQISMRLTLFTLAFVPLLVMLLQRLVRRLRRHARARSKERGEVTATVTERIGAIRLIRSYGEEERESAAFDAQTNRYRKAGDPHPALLLAHQPDHRDLLRLPRHPDHLGRHPARACWVSTRRSRPRPSSCS